MADSGSDSDWDDWANYQLGAAPGGAPVPQAASDARDGARGSGSDSDSDWDDWASSMLEAAPGVAPPEAAVHAAAPEQDETAATLAQAAAALSALAERHTAATAATAASNGGGSRTPGSAHSPRADALPAGGDYWALLAEHGARAVEASLVLPESDPVWQKMQQELSARGETPSASCLRDVAPVTSPSDLRVMRTWLASLLPATRHLCGALEGKGWRWWRCGPASHPRAVVGVWEDNIETLAWADSRDALCEALSEALTPGVAHRTPPPSADHLRLHLVDEGVCEILASRLPRSPPFLSLAKRPLPALLMVQLRPAAVALEQPRNLVEVELGFDDVRVLAKKAKLTLPPWAAHARAIALVPESKRDAAVANAAAWAAVTSTSEVVGVFCAPARRRRGLAAAALGAALASVGAGSAYCLLPLGNDPARSLLRTMGFEPVASGATAAFAAAAMASA